MKFRSREHREPSGHFDGKRECQSTPLTRVAGQNSVLRFVNRGLSSAALSLKDGLFG